VKINPSSHIPIYLQIAEGIRAAVAAGVYRPGEALPSLSQGSPRQLIPAGYWPKGPISANMRKTPSRSCPSWASHWAMI